MDGLSNVPWHASSPVSSGTPSKVRSKSSPPSTLTSAASTMSSITSAVSSSSARGVPDAHAPCSPAPMSEVSQQPHVPGVATADADPPGTLIRRVRSVTPEAERSQISELADLVKAFRASVTVKDRTYRLRRYKACFTGVDAVRTLITIGAAPTIEGALAVGNELIAHQLIEHVYGEHCLKNENLFYRFVEPDQAPMQRTLSRPRAVQY